MNWLKRTRDRFYQDQVEAREEELRRVSRLLRSRRARKARRARARREGEQP